MHPNPPSIFARVLTELFEQAQYSPQGFDTPLPGKQLAFTFHALRGRETGRHLADQLPSINLGERIGEVIRQGLQVAPEKFIAEIESLEAQKRLKTRLHMFLEWILKKNENCRSHFNIIKNLFAILKPSDQMRSSYLVSATQNNYPHSVNHLLYNGCDPNIIPVRDLNILDTINLSVDKTPLMIAVKNGHIECVKSFIQAAKNGVHVDFNLSGRHSSPPLVEAAGKGRADCLQLFIEAKKDGLNIDLDQVHPEHRETPFTTAAFNKQSECLRVLIQAKKDNLAIDLNARGNYTGYALPNVRSSIECLTVLIEAKQAQLDIDFNVRGTWNRTLLILSAELFNYAPEFFAALIHAKQKGMDIDLNAKDDSGNTALTQLAGAPNKKERVVSQDIMPCLRMLLASPDLDLRMHNQGARALNKAAGHPEIEALIRQALDAAHRTETPEAKMEMAAPPALIFREVPAAAGPAVAEAAAPVADNASSYWRFCSIL